MYFNLFHSLAIFLLCYFLFFFHLLNFYLNFFPGFLMIAHIISCGRFIGTNKREDLNGKCYLAKVNIRVRG